MQKRILMALAAAGAFTLAGCQTAPTATATPGLSDEAKMALSWADADVKDAQKVGMLWTTAADALKAAKEAAAKGDSATTIAKAKLASEHAKLGAAQKKYPHTPVQ
jgi:murein lipoprotein